MEPEELRRIHGLSELPPAVFAWKLGIAPATVWRYMNGLNPIPKEVAAKAKELEAAILSGKGISEIQDDVQEVQEPIPEIRSPPPAPLVIGVLVSQGKPLPPRLRAELLRRVFQSKRLLPADVATKRALPVPYVAPRMVGGGSTGQRMAGAGVGGTRQVRWRKRLVRWSAWATRVACVLLVMLILRVWIRAEIRDVLTRFFEERSTSTRPNDESDKTERKPLKIFDGQKQAPCEGRGEVEADGFCWSVGDSSRPCPPAGQKHDGKCLLPLPETEKKKPVSDPPDKSKRERR